MATASKDLVSLRHNQQLLFFLLFSLVTVSVWVGISLITSQTKTSLSPELQALALPLNPSLNLEVLGQIEQKRTYDPSTLTSFPIYSLVDAEQKKAAKSLAPAAASQLSELANPQSSITPISGTASASAIPAELLTAPTATTSGANSTLIN